jgi:large subunit ribosomal protein L3
MIRGIVGRKVGMTQIFDDEGRQVPVTVIAAGPCHVLQVRSLERDGYAAVQVGFEDVPLARLPQPQRGRQKNLAAGRKADIERRKEELAAQLSALSGDENAADDDKASLQRRLDALEQELQAADKLGKRRLFEFDLEGGEAPAIGTAVTVEMFAAGDKVRVTGTSKGRGFAGAMKRHGFHGSDEGHGTMVPRKPQSSGATDAARTFKGTRKPGHMGSVRRTQRGLTVVRVDAERGLLLVKGAVPGPNKGLVLVRKQD